jgi:hypothetical protein
LAVPVVLVIMQGRDARAALAIGFTVGATLVMLDRELGRGRAVRNKRVEKPE